jgi:hypothetical protein
MISYTKQNEYTDISMPLTDNKERLILNLRDLANRLESSENLTISNISLQSFLSAKLNKLVLRVIE